ncbi:MAG: LPD38 domain-containing protein [Planctomycetota bacterium]
MSRITDIAEDMDKRPWQYAIPILGPKLEREALERTVERTPALPAAAGSTRIRQVAQQMMDLPSPDERDRAIVDEAKWLQKAQVDALRSMASRVTSEAGGLPMLARPGEDPDSLDYTAEPPTVDEQALLSWAMQKPKKGGSLLLPGEGKIERQRPLDEMELEEDERAALQRLYKEHIDPGVAANLAEAYGRRARVVNLNRKIVEAAFLTPSRDTLNRVLDARDALAEREVADPLEGPWAAQVAYKNVGNLPYMVEGLRGGGVGFLGGVGAGALGGAIAGAATPTVGEEPLTVAGGAVIGGSMGWKTGMASAFAVQSLGDSIYRLHREMGLDLDVARSVGVAAAIPNALLETNQLHTLLPGTVKKAAAEAFGTEAAKKGLRKALEEGKLAGLRWAAREYGENLTSEVLAEELPQKIIENQATKLAQWLDKEADVEISAESLKNELIDTVAHIGESTEGMALLAAGGPAVDVAAEAVPGAARAGASGVAAAVRKGGGLYEAMRGAVEERAARGSEAARAWVRARTRVGQILDRGRRAQAEAGRRLRRDAPVKRPSKAATGRPTEAASTQETQEAAEAPPPPVSPSARAYANSQGLSGEELRALNGQGQGTRGSPTKADIDDYVAGRDAPGREWSVEALADTFGVDRSVAVAVDSLVRSMGMRIGDVRLQRGGDVADNALFQEILGRREWQQRQGDALGATTLLGTGQHLIQAFENADASTAVHEIFHVAEDQFLNPEVPPDMRRGINRADIETYREWAGHNAATTEAELRAAREKGARALERYLRDGSAPTTKLRAVFAKIAAWMRDIYQRIKGSDVDVSIPDDVRRVFDRLVTRAERAAVIEEGMDALPADVQAEIDLAAEAAAVEPVEQLEGARELSTVEMVARYREQGADLAQVARRLMEDRGVNPALVSLMWAEMENPRERREATAPQQTLRERLEALREWREAGGSKEEFLQALEEGSELPAPESGQHTQEALDGLRERVADPDVDQGELEDELAVAGQVAGVETYVEDTLAAWDVDDKVGFLEAYEQGVAEAYITDWPGGEALKGEVLAMLAKRIQAELEGDLDVGYQFMHLGPFGSHNNPHVAESKAEMTGGAKRTQEALDANKEALREEQGRQADRGSRFERARERLWDASGRVKAALRKTNTPEGRQAAMLRVLQAGATAYAGVRGKEAMTRVYASLGTPEEEELFADYLDVMRAIEAEAIQRERGVEMEHHMGMTAEDAQAWLRHQQTTLDKATWRAVERAAQRFYAEMRKNLRRMYEHDLLHEALYRSLLENHKYYSPRWFIEHYVDPVSQQARDGGRVSVSESGIQPLDEGSQGAMITNPRVFLAQTILRTETRIAKNRATLAVLNFVRAHGKQAQQVAKPAVIEKWEKGEAPVWQEPPEGWTELKCLEDGMERRVWMRDEYAQSWNATPTDFRHGYLRGLWTVLRFASGTAPVKALATGYNAAFALTNVPRDLGLIWVQPNSPYSGFLPWYGVQMLHDMASVAGDALFRKGEYRDYVKEGGGLGLVQHQHATDLGPVDRANLPKFSKALLNVADAFAYIGETSEILTRLALRKRAQRAGYSSTEATYMARAYHDFHQGGPWLKFLDSVFPYLNASVQATRSAVRAHQQNPARFYSCVAQISAVGVPLTMMNMLIAPKGWRKVPENIKARYFVFCLPDKLAEYETPDGQTRYRYYTIPKPEFARSFLGVFEASAEYLMDRHYFERPTRFRWKRVWHGAKGSLEMVPGVAMPPTVEAIQGYATNTDFWRGQPIWRGREDVSPSMERGRQTHPAFERLSDVAKLAGVELSPARSQYFVSQLFPVYNPAVQWVSYGTHIGLEGLPQKHLETFKRQMLHRTTGLSRVSRLTPTTDQYSRDDLRRLEAEEADVKQRHDLLLQDKWEQEATREEVARWAWMEVGREHPEEAKRLADLDRVYRQRQGVPDWFVALSYAGPEARGRAAAERYVQADAAERREMLRLFSLTPHLASDRFWAQFNRSVQEAQAAPR